MKLKSLPDEEKPREKALLFGIEKISNAELLAIIIRTGFKEHSAVDIANELLKRFNGLVGLSLASYDEITNIDGMKKAKSLGILAMIEFSKRVAYQNLSRDKIVSLDQIYLSLEPRLGSYNQERLVVIFLNAKNFIVSIRELFIGGLDEHTIHPRDIFREAIRYNSAKIILVHNHPSGDPTPSLNDIETTKEIYELGKKMGILVADHLIISKGSYVSMKRLKLF